MCKRFNVKRVKKTVTRIQVFLTNCCSPPLCIPTPASPYFGYKNWLDFWRLCIVINTVLKIFNLRSLHLVFLFHCHLIHNAPPNGYIKYKCKKRDKDFIRQNMFVKQDYWELKIGITILFTVSFLFLFCFSQEIRNDRTHYLFSKCLKLLIRVLRIFRLLWLFGFLFALSFSRFSVRLWNFQLRTIINLILLYNWTFKNTQSQNEGGKIAEKKILYHVVFPIFIFPEK